MKAVAYELKITRRTVAAHKYAVMELLQLKTNAELLQYALKHRISPLTSAFFLAILSILPIDSLPNHEQYACKGSFSRDRIQSATLTVQVSRALKPRLRQ